MSRITKNGDYFSINIPYYIMDITGWDENTELVFTPYLKEPDSPLTPDIPILIKQVKKRKERNKEKKE